MKLSTTPYLIPVLLLTVLVGFLIIRDVFTLDIDPELINQFNELN